MIDLGILITGGVGIITTVISGWTSWFFARRKYNSEVDNNLIENMQQSLEFYKKLSDDNKNRLDEVLKKCRAGTGNKGFKETDVQSHELHLY